MGFSLRNWLEEATAQVNPFDNGKTAQTVRTERQRPAPAVTQNKRTIQNGVVSKPKQNVLDKVRDVFDANTEMDNYKRNSGLELARYNSLLKATQSPNVEIANQADQRLRNAAWKSQDTPVVTLQDNVQKASDTLANVGKNIGYGIVEAPVAIGRFTGNAAAVNTNDYKNAQASEEAARKIDTQVYGTMLKTLRDPTADENRKQAAINYLNTYGGEYQSGMDEVRAKVASENDPKRIAAASASLLADLATLGVAGASKAGVKGAYQTARAAQLAKGASTAKQVTTGLVAGSKRLGIDTAKTAALGGIAGGTSAYIQDPNATFKQALTGAGAGAAMGAGMPLAFIGASSLPTIAKATGKGVKATTRLVRDAGKPTGEALQNLKLKETQIGAQIQDLLGKRSIAETRRPDLIPILDERINAKYAELDSVKKSMNSRNQAGFVANPFYKDPEVANLDNVITRNQQIILGNGKPYTAAEAKKLWNELDKRYMLPKRTSDSGTTLVNITPNELRSMLNDRSGKGATLIRQIQNKLDDSNADYARSVGQDNRFEELNKRLDELDKDISIIPAGKRNKTNAKYNKINKEYDNINKKINDAELLQTEVEKPFIDDYKNYVRENADDIANGNEKAINTAQEKLDRITIELAEDLPETRLLTDSQEYTKTYGLEQFNKDIAEVAPNQSDLLTYKPPKNTKIRNGTSKAMSADPKGAPIEKTPQVSKTEFIPSNGLARKKHRLENEIEALNNRLSNQNDMPGAYVTGRAGISNARQKKQYASLERTIDDSKRLNKAIDELKATNDSIERQRRNALKPKVEKKQTVVADASKIRVSESDSLMLYDYGFSGDKKTQLAKYVKYLDGGGEPHKGLVRINGQYSQTKNQLGVHDSLADNLPNQTGNTPIIPKSSPKPTLQDALEGKNTKIKKTKETIANPNPTERQVGTVPRQSSAKPSLQTDTQNVQVKEPTEKIKLSQPKNTPDVGAKQLEELYNVTLKDKNKKKAFERISREYLGDVEAAKITADMKAMDFKKTHKLTDEESLATILHKDNPLSTNVNKKVQKATDDLKKTYDDLYTYFTKEKGIDMGYQHDYYPREYVNVKTGDQMSAAQYDLLQRGTGRTQGRVSDELADWKLKYTDPAEGLKSYYKNLERAAAGRRYMQELEAEGLVIKASGEPVQGFRPIIAEGLQNSDGSIYYAKKEVADKLNTMFGSREASNVMEQALEKGEGVNSLWQSVVLSGGVPNTPLNAFGFMQVMKETMALHPVKAMKGLYGGMNKKFAQEYFERKAPTMAMMAKEGIGVRYSLDKGSLKGMGRIKDAFNNKGTGQAINQAWNEITNDATFSRFMPVLMTEHFDNIYKHGIKKGLTPKQASKIAGESTKNFYGITDLYKTKVRPKAVDDATGTFLFAPRFRESMLNFWIKNAKSVGVSDGKWNMLKPEYRDNAKFLAASGVVFAAYDALNYELNGTHLWENPDGKKDKVLIPGVDPDGKTLGVPFLPSIATVPRNAAMFGYNTLTGNFGEAGKNAGSFLSMPVKTAGELLTNENYFGQPIVDKDANPLERLTQGGSYVAKSTLQPWVREGLNVAGQGLPGGVKDALGIKKKSGFETVSNALESPIRFYDPKYMRGGGDNFRNADGKTNAQKKAEKGTNLTLDQAKNIQKKEYGGKYAKMTESEIEQLAKTDTEARQYLKSLEATKAAYGKTPTMPDNLPDNAKKLLERESRLTKDGKGKWNKLATTDKSIVDTLKKWNNGRDLPVTNETAKAWANYEKKRVEGTLGKLEAVDEKKKILRSAYNSQLNEDEKDLYKLSKTRLIDAYNQGLINDKNIDNALAVENQLFEAGLIDKKTLHGKLGMATGAKGKSKKSSGRKSGGKTRSIGNLEYKMFGFGDPKAVTGQLRKLIEQTQS